MCALSQRCRRPSRRGSTLCLMKTRWALPLTRTSRTWIPTRSSARGRRPRPTTTGGYTGTPCSTTLKGTTRKWRGWPRKQEQAAAPTRCRRPCRVPRRHCSLRPWRRLLRRDRRSQPSMPQCGWTFRARAMTPKASVARSPTLGGRHPSTSARRPTSGSPFRRRPRRPCRRRPLRCRLRHLRYGALHTETRTMHMGIAMVRGTRGRRFEQDGRAVIASRTSRRDRRRERPCHFGRSFAAGSGPAVQ